MEDETLNRSVKDVHFQQYFNCVYGVGEREMCRVFLYLYHHYQPNPSVYVGDVLDPDGSMRARIRKGKGPIGRLGNRELAVLTRRESPVNMDIALLYLLLQLTCGLEPDTNDGSVWNSPVTDPTKQSLEHQLYLLKELRNDLIHNPRAYKNLTKQQLEEKVRELERLCCEVVTKAAHRTGGSLATVASITSSISATLREILNNSHPPNLHPQEWAMLAREEQRAIPHHQQELFDERQLTLSQGSLTTVDQLDMLDQVLAWRCPDGSVPQLILMRGQAGVGKTSLCQDIWKSWVGRDGVDEECDLVLQVQCGRVVTRDVARLVQEDLLPSSSQHCDPGQLLGFLASLRVLWLLDGLEEPAPEAIHLLGGIIEKFSNKHLVMVTCQPSYVKEVTSLAADRKVCEVTLDGLSDGGAHSMIKRMLHGKLYPKFFEDVENLDGEVNAELRNPLKLKLFVTLWQEGTLDVWDKASLPHLYRAVEAAQVLKVSARMAGKWSLTTREAKDRVQAWLKELYEVAFEMIAKNNLVLLDKISIESLEEKSRRLLPSYTDCFSTFLTYLPDASLQSDNYRFIHLTQQRYMAAQYLCHQLLSLPCPAVELTQMLQLDHADTNNFNRFYDILLWVLSSLVARGKLEESLEEILISALSRCGRCDWMEVLHYTGYSERVAERISQHMPDSWVITDTLLPAATLLLKHATPSVFSITINNDPDTLNHLLPFLRQVAVTDSQVHLFFCHYFSTSGKDKFCDKYLKVLCDQEAVCTVTKFKGALTADGCISFFQKLDIHYLEMSVSSMKILETLLMVTKSAVNLQKLVICLTITDFKEFLKISAKESVSLAVNMPCVKDVHLKRITQVLQFMSRRYSVITLHQVSAKGALKFIKELAARGIKVDSLQRLINLNINGTMQNIILRYGRIPTELSNAAFSSLWEQPKLVLIERDNKVQVSMKVPTEYYHKLVH